MRIFHELLEKLKRFFGFFNGEDSNHVEKVPTRSSASTYEASSFDCPHPKGRQVGVAEVPGVVKCERCGAII